MRDRRGLRGKSRRDADDRAVERAKAEAAKERAEREAEVARIDDDLEVHTDDITSLQNFRNRDAGFAQSDHEHDWNEINGRPDLGDYAKKDHKHGYSDITSVNWGAVGTRKSPVPAFAKSSELQSIRRDLANLRRTVNQLGGGGGGG